MPVVKSDAYGHGMIPVAETLSGLGVDYLGVFELEEALSLRAAGIKIPILILMGIMDEEVEEVVQHNLTPAIFRFEIARSLSDMSLKKGKITPVHLKVDTGMGRLGIRPEEIGRFLKRLLSLKGIILEGIFSHFSVSEQPDHPYTQEQMREFMHAIIECQRFGIFNTARHIANSGAILGHIGIDYGMVRPGILLYGSLPSSGWKKSIPVRPVMTFKSRIILIKRVPPNTSISYGRSYITDKEQTIATIPVGYDDGYSRLLSNKGVVLVHGRRAPVVGAVCMNLTMIDITGIPDVKEGDEVVVLGIQGKERITAEEIAAQMGTISYEVYCLIGKSNQRTYINR